MNGYKKEGDHGVLKNGVGFMFLATILLFAGCSKPTEQIIEIKRFPVDSLDGVITQSGVHLDKEVSKDGNGSLRIATSEPMVVRLFELGDVDIEKARLIYQAKLRTENVEGRVYLEMWTHFPGKGEFFSRGIQSPLSGTTNWVTEETPFFLKKGENPDNIKLNLVIEGKGMAWIDDIRVMKAAL
jgi:hypothetical protein